MGARWNHNPVLAHGHLWSLKGRRLAGSSRYMSATGSKVALFGLSNKPTDNTGYVVTVMAEGDFDTILVTQEAGPLVWACTLGGVGNRLDRWAWELRDSNPILIAYDADTVGAASAASTSAMSKRMRVIRPIGGKDITEMYLAGHDLAAWIRRELSPETSRVTVDSGMFDENSSRELHGYTQVDRGNGTVPTVLLPHQVTEELTSLNSAPRVRSAEGKLGSNRAGQVAAIDPRQGQLTLQDQEQTPQRRGFPSLCRNCGKATRYPNGCIWCDEKMSR